MKTQYRNVFAEIGIEQAQIKARLEEIRDFYFYGKEDERVYYPVGDDMAYIMDTGNNDARTEGMSYGMMICVQLDMHEEFDRLWKWAKTYMWMADGFHEGFCVVLRDGRHEKCGQPGTGRRGVLRDGALLRIEQMGGRGRYFQLFPRGARDPAGVSAQRGERQGRRADVEQGQLSDTVRAGGRFHGSVLSSASFL